MNININDPDEICTWCRFVVADENGRTLDCKKSRKNSGNNSGIPCGGCKKFVLQVSADMPYFMRKEAEELQ